MIPALSRSCSLALLTTVGCHYPVPDHPSGADQHVVAAATVAAAPVIHFGRLVDVYGLRTSMGKSTIELHRRDVLMGSLLDDRSGACFTFLPCNPDSLHKRILIAADIDSAAFAAALQQIEAAVTELGPVVPRDAAVRVTWPGQGADAHDLHVQLREQDQDAPVITRLIRRDGSVILDPVLHGTEAVRHGTTVSVGMPQAALRLWIGRGDAVTTYEFDARGLMPDSEPPRIIGEMTVHLERVGRLADDISVLTLFLGGIRQALDPGDILRLHEPSTHQPLFALEVLANVPATVGGGARRTHVQVRTELDAQGVDVLEQFDPSNLPGFPREGGAARDEFVVAHGPRITIVAPFEASEGDDAGNFVRIAARDIEDTDANRHNVPPDASYELRFSTAIDLSTFRVTMLDAERSHYEVPLRVFVNDASQHSFRMQPPIGLCLTPAMQQAILADREQPSERRRPNYVLQVVGGEHGVRSPSGTPMAESLQLGFSLDPEAADNIVSSRVVRYRTK